MKKQSVVTVFLLAAVTIFSLAGGREAAKQTVRLAGIFPPDYYVMKAYYKMVDKIKNRTKGELDIKIFPSNQLGSYDQAFQEVMRGTIEMMGNYATSRFNKKFEIASYPGMVTGFADVAKLIARDSPYHTFLKDAYKECGVVYIGSFVDALMGCAISKRKNVTAPYDTKSKGLVARVAAVEAWRKWYGAMGYQVATVPFAEVFSSMQTGIIDCDTGAGPEAAYATLKDVMGSYIQYNNVFAVNDFIISKSLWDSLDEKTQKIIYEAFDEVVASELNDAENSHKEYIDKMQKAGIKVLTPKPEEQKAMIDIAKKQIWPQFYGVVSKEILDRIEKCLAK